MDTFSVVYPPNRPFDRLMMPSLKPHLYDYLLCIDCATTGETVLGSSNIAGTYWEGTLFLYTNVKKAANNEYSNFYIGPTPILDAKFVNNSSLILLAESNNYLKLFSTSEYIGEDSSLKSLDDYESDGIVERIAVSNETKFVTCSENAVATWEISDNLIIKQIHNYWEYHTELVNDVDVNPQDANDFVSVSQDRKMCLWDARSSTPAKVLYANEFCGLTAVSWSKEDANLIATGTESGAVYVMDVRKEGQYLFAEWCFDDKVHRLRWNGNNLGICGDSSKVIVCSLMEDNFKKVYVSESHEDIVRGLTWCDADLFTCGFGKQIVHHVL